MAIQRMDNVGSLVEDMDAAIAFVVELGTELEGRAEAEGLFADRCTALDGVRCGIAMLRTLDGHSLVLAVLDAQPGGQGRLFDTGCCHAAFTGSPFCPVDA